MRLSLKDKLLLTKREKEMLQELDDLIQLIQRQLVKDGQRVTHTYESK